MEELRVEPEAKVAARAHGEMVAVAEHEEGILAAPPVHVQSFVRWRLVA